MGILSDNGRILREADMEGQTRTVGLGNPAKELDGSFEMGRQWVALVAVGKYRHWGPLRYPVKEAEALWRILVARTKRQNLKGAGRSLGGSFGLQKRGTGAES